MRHKTNNPATHKIGVLLTDEHYRMFIRLAEALRRTPADTLRQMVLEGYDRFFSASNVPIGTGRAAK